MEAERFPRMVKFLLRIDLMVEQFCRYLVLTRRSIERLLAEITLFIVRNPPNVQSIAISRNGINKWDMYMAGGMATIKHRRSLVFWLSHSRRHRPTLPVSFMLPEYDGGI